MIFLIEYDRGKGRVVMSSTFPDAALAEAEEARLELELTVNRDTADREVVLLQATDEEALRRTHRRYFEDMKELIRHSEK